MLLMKSAAGAGGRGSLRRSGVAGFGMALGIALGSLATEASAHPLGMYIYRDANDKLSMIFPWNNYWPIKYRVPPFAGYLDADYPYEEALFDRPSANLFRTHVGAKIEIVISEMAPGFWLRNHTDINLAYHEPGEHFVIGTTGSGFLTFPWWHLDESDPAFIPGQESYAASFYLRDITGLHTDSDVYTFTVYPNEGFCPADLTTTAIPTQPGYGIPDQMLTSDDFFYFIIGFSEGNWIVADLTSTAVAGTPGYGVPDGLINGDDFFYYIGLYALGC